MDEAATTSATTLTVTSVVAGGDGLARDETGRVVFVAGALPGERVEVTLGEQRRDYARAEVVSVLDPSPMRVAPPCPYVDAGCGGCDWQHVRADDQRHLKALVVADALRRQAGPEVLAELEVSPGPVLSATGYRTTLRGIAVDGRFGFRRRGSHEVVPVDPCLVSHPLLAPLVSEGRFPDGPVVLRAGARTGERLVVVEGPNGGQDGQAEGLDDGVLVVTGAELDGGRRAWLHEEAAGRRWRVSARSFFQVRPDGAEALVQLVGEALGPALASGGRLIDLFGGVGLFAGTLGAALGPDGQVTLVEQSASAVADARVNLRDVPCRIVRTNADRWHPTRADAMVADPPRRGLGRKGVATVAAVRPKRLALVSCDAAALGRDARLLADAGYRLASVTVVDLFPHTSHVEVVSRFDPA